jgi:hypothetical protein
MGAKLPIGLSWPKADRQLSGSALAEADIQSDRS